MTKFGSKRRKNDADANDLTTLALLTTFGGQKTVSDDADAGADALPALSDDVL